MSETGEQIADSNETALITQILIDFCERSGTSEIAELNEEAENPVTEEETNEIKKENELKKLEKNYEFLKLESGSLPANFLDKS